jgi:ribonuclease G
MFRELIINSTEHETRVALLEDGTIAELFIERKDDINITGNIYKGRVQRVLPGMQAAFVDIGMKQAAFIYVDDVYQPDNTDEEEENNPGENAQEASEESEDDFKSELPEEEKPVCHIDELIRENQEIMIQVSKSPLGSKGARVTTHISLPGRYLVLMPMVDHIGVSRRIENEEERCRLKELIKRIRTDNYGFIIRTAAEAIDVDKLEKEMIFLVNLWSRIQKKLTTAPVPSLLHNELNITLRAVRDILTKEADKVIVDSKSAYEQVLSFLQEFLPGLAASVELYRGEEPIFDAYNLAQIRWVHCH